MTDERPAGVALDPPHSNGQVYGEVVEDERQPRSKGTRIALIAVFLIVGGLWAYALVYSVVRKDPERLSSSEHAAVEQACKTAQTRMQDLPAVDSPPTDAKVAARAAAETNVLGEMVKELRAIHPQRAATAEALSKWLDDWDSLLVARRAYAQDVHPGAEIVIPAVNGTGITIRMNKYAESKAVDDCDTTALGAENVNALHKAS